MFIESTKFSPKERKAIGYKECLILTVFSLVICLERKWRETLNRMTTKATGNANIIITAGRAGLRLANGYPALSVQVWIPCGHPMSWLFSL